VLGRWLTLVLPLSVSLARAEPLPQPLTPALLAKSAASLMPTEGIQNGVSPEFDRQLLRASGHALILGRAATLAGRHGVGVNTGLGVGTRSL